MTDQQYMQRAIDLAKLGIAKAFPNPMVGAVIVHNGKIIGEGYHHKSGMSHAEVEAIKNVRNKELLKESTLYVSLEPCCHHGKTPPCADLIIKVGIPRVVVAMQDPFYQVSGKGIDILRRNGIEVIVGVLEKEAQMLNRFFIINQIQKRPYITLKWAQSKDGFIDKKRDNMSESPIQFSSDIYQRIVHKERMEHDAILVGYRTALLDNPSLTNRYWYGRSPIRVVLDPQLRLPPDLYIFTDNQVQTIVVSDVQNMSIRTTYMSDSVVVQYIDFNQSIAKQLLQLLWKNNIYSVLIEGGASTIQKFVDTGYYDEILIEENQHIVLKDGVKAPRIL